MDPASLMIAGTALNVFGQWQANFAQAQAERENAQWLNEQAEFIRQSTARSLSIYERQASQFKEEQLGIIGASGVELSGTASDIFSDTLKSISEEIDAIQAQGEMQEREARLKAFQANRQARRLTDPMTNIMQAAGPSLITAGRLKAGGLI